MLASIIAGYLWLQETHPDLTADVNYRQSHDIAEQTPMITAAGTNADPGVDLRQESYGTFNDVDVHEDKHWRVSTDGSSTPASYAEKPSAKAFTWQIVMLVVALGLFTYHSMCYDHLLPIFLQDERVDNMSILAASSPFHVEGGLGLTTKTVGLVMSVNGVFALFIQAVIFPWLAGWLGVWKLFVLSTVVHPVAYFIVPYLAYLPQSLLFSGIYTCLTIRNLFSILVYPLILILLKQASPTPSCLGKVNGLAASVGAACRTIAPPVAGLLYGLGIDIGFTGLAWYGAGIVAVMSTLQLWFIPREKKHAATIRSAAPYLTSEPQQPCSEIIHVTVVSSSEEV